MARPETHNDLDSWTTRPVELATINTTEFLQKGSARLCAAIFSLIEAAEADGYAVDRSTFTISREKTLDELDELLASAQRGWDADQERYEKAAADPAAFLEEKAWARFYVDNHAEKEGLPAVEWPEEVSS